MAIAICRLRHALGERFGDGHRLPAVDPLDYPVGEIITAGSSTVFPLSERMAELWTDEGGVAPSIASIGSGAGFERFCVEGETDISNASRAIKDSERESCKAIGRDAIEFRVGTDALAVTVSAENDFVSDVTLEELAMIFSSAETWSDVRAEWPAKRSSASSPAPTAAPSITSWKRSSMKTKSPSSAPTRSSPRTTTCWCRASAGSPYAIGFFGYAYYVENQDALNILSIEGIEANAQTTDDGSYPLARPLYIYSDAGIMAEKPQVAAFISFYMSNVNDEVINVGYFPASASALNAAKNAFLDAMTEN